MPYTIPNAADAGNTNQAEPDKVDFDIITAGSAQTGVVSGCAVTPTTLLTLDVAAGVVAVLGIPVTVATGTVVVGTADVTNPRFDLVVVNSSGTKSVTAGTAAAEPVYPAVPASSVCLAAVYIPALLATILASNIIDKRVTVVPLTPGAWTAFVPTLSGGWLLGNSTYVATFSKIARTINFSAVITIGSTATKGTGLLAALPVAAANAGAAVAGLQTYFRDAGNVDFWGGVRGSSTTVVDLTPLLASGTYVSEGGVTATTPFTWVTGDLIIYGGAYEAAA